LTWGRRRVSVHKFTGMEPTNRQELRAKTKKKVIRRGVKGMSPFKNNAGRSRQPVKGGDLIPEKTHRRLRFKPGTRKLPGSLLGWV